MNVLAIESSALVASVALADEQKLIGEYILNNKKNHSVTLMPMIENLCQQTGYSMDSIDLIGVSSGPGSFTGLRIGSATAKGLAHILNIPIASVCTLEALAMNITNTDKLICPIMDARRNQVYSAIYEYDHNHLSCLKDKVAISIEELIEIIRQYNKQVIFLGDGCAIHQSYIQQALEDDMCTFASSQHNLQRASSIAIAALQYSKEGRLDTYDTHLPIYLRKPQAEREYNNNKSQ